VVGVGMFVLRDVRTASAEAQQMYARSVLGLRQIGELQYQAQETRRSTLNALTTNDSNLQVEYADQSREPDRRVTEGISEYLKAGADAERDRGRTRPAARLVRVFQGSRRSVGLHSRGKHLNPASTVWANCAPIRIGI
jgi:hypothetical protein